MSYLQLGDSNRDVEVWQRFLADIWLLDIDRVPLGTFDEATEDATRVFQSGAGIDITGIVDSRTTALANLRGLQLMRDRILTGPTKSSVVLAAVAFILLISLSHCMILPDGGQSYLAMPLPISPTLVPGTPVPPPCPGWFC